MSEFHPRDDRKPTTAHDDAVFGRLPDLHAGARAAEFSISAGPDPRQINLDDTDRHLLALLQANAREPAAALGRKLRLARTTVVARIARLERAGVVAGYGLRLGHRVGQSSVRAYCGVSVAPKSSAGVVRSLQRLPEVEEISTVSGMHDHLLLLRCENHEALDRLLDQIGQIDGVKELRTSIVLSVKLERRYAAN